MPLSDDVIKQLKQSNIIIPQDQHTGRTDSNRDQQPRQQIIRQPIFDRQQGLKDHQQHTLGDCHKQDHVVDIKNVFLHGSTW